MFLSFLNLPRRETVFQCIYLFITGLMMLTPGFTTGFAIVALPYLSNANSTSEIQLNTKMSALFVSVINIAHGVGVLLTLFLINRGRRSSILVGGICCNVGWIIIASSTTAIQLIVGRSITGKKENVKIINICVQRVKICGTNKVRGFSALSIVSGVRIYISEMLTLDLARTLNPLISIFISTGYLVICVVGYLIGSNWRLVASIIILILSLSLVLVALFVPESPRWLLLMDRKEQAKKSLLILRGLKTPTSEFENEFEEMVTYSQKSYDFELKSNDRKVNKHNLNSFGEIENEISTISKVEGTKLTVKVTSTKNLDKGHNSCSLKNIKTKMQCVIQILKQPEVWKPFVILNIFFSFSDFCGGSVLFSYAIDIIKRAGVTNDPFLITIMIALLQVIGDAAFTIFSAKWGRRPLAISTGVIVSLLFIALGVYNQLFLDCGISSIPLTCLLLLVVTETIGFTNLPWTMMPEIYPTRYIQVLGPLSLFFQTPYSFLAAQFYPILAEYSFFTLLYLYSGTAILGTLFVTLVLPETVGKSKVEIEDHFRKKGKSCFFRKNVTYVLNDK